MIQHYLTIESEVLVTEQVICYNMPCNVYIYVYGQIKSASKLFLQHANMKTSNGFSEFWKKTFFDAFVLHTYFEKHFQ